DHGGFHGFNGGHGNVGFGHFDGRGFNNFGGFRFDSGRRFGFWPYYSFYRPYRYFYRPYAYSYFSYPYFYGYYGYPSSYYGYLGDYYSYPSYNYSYPFSYPSYYYGAPAGSFVNGCDNCDADAPTATEHVVGRPVADVAQLEVRLPDPQATIWVQGKQIDSAGA